MKFEELPIKGAYLIKPDIFEDERGSFYRQFCKKEFKNAGIDFEICQCNVSTNAKRGTIRGLHYQKEPYPEKKIVSVTKGKIFDVIVDLRKESPTYLKWAGVELSGDKAEYIYIPPMVAHGFQVLEDNSDVFYQLGEYFNENSYSGVRWDDAAFGIEWKDIKPVIINERDQNYKLFNA